MCQGRSILANLQPPQLRQWNSRAAAADSLTWRPCVVMPITRISRLDASKDARIDPTSLSRHHSGECRSLMLVSSKSKIIIDTSAGIAVGSIQHPTFPLIQGATFDRVTGAQRRGTVKKCFPRVRKGHVQFRTQFRIPLMREGAAESRRPGCAPCPAGVCAFGTTKGAT